MTSTPIFDALAAELRTAGMSSDESREPDDQTAESTGQDVRRSGSLE